ncbi:MAG: leucine-rich repeat domain-containing protein [Streptococcaceae bacterium]|nr:leucine-rich repeat domain-containing protein [Streptococcaceae bacterium]
MNKYLHSSSRLLKFFAEHEEFFDKITEMNSIDDSLKYIQESFPDYTLGEFVTDLSQLHSISENEQLDLETLDKISGGLTISKPFLFKAVATTAGILALPLFTGGQTKVHAGGPTSEKATSTTSEIPQGNLKYKLSKLGNSATAKVISVGSGHFTDGKVTIPEKITVNEVTYEVTEINERVFRNNSEIKEVEIPASIKIIGKFAFFECSNLTSATFAENSKLTKIEEGTFQDCKSLESIEIPATVNTIGKFAFSGCSNLTSATFAENSQLTEIKQTTFWNCKSLKSIKIPATVTMIEKQAFALCTNLLEILFDEDVSRISIDSTAVQESKSLITAVPVEDSNKTENTKKAKTYSLVHHKYQEELAKLSDGNKKDVVKNVFNILKEQLSEKELVTFIFTYCVFHHPEPADAAVEIVKLAINKESAASKITAVTYKVPGLQKVAREVRTALDASSLLNPQQMKRRMALEDIRVKSNVNWDDSKQNGTLDVASLPADSIVDIADKSGENIVPYSQSDPSLFKALPSPADIRQGCIGDCFLLSSISAILAQDQNIIIDSMRQMDDGKVVVRACPRSLMK